MHTMILHTTTWIAGSEKHSFLLNEDAVNLHIDQFQQISHIKIIPRTVIVCSAGQLITALVFLGHDQHMNMLGTIKREKKKERNKW